MSTYYDEWRTMQELFICVLLIILLVFSVSIATDSLSGSMIRITSLPLFVWYTSEVVKTIRKYLAYRERHTELRFRITGKRLKIENHYNP